MAARRLLLLMLVMLAVSSLAAALVTPRSEREQGTATTTEQTEGSGSDDPAPVGRLVSETIDARGRSAEPIRLRRGDELALTVRSRTATQVEIPALGLLEDAARGAPARFDLLLDREGRLEVRTLEPRRVIARIVVSPRRDEERKRGS